MDLGLHPIISGIGSFALLAVASYCVGEGGEILGQKYDASVIGGLLIAWLNTGMSLLSKNAVQLRWMAQKRTDFVLTFVCSPFPLSIDSVPSLKLILHSFYVSLVPDLSSS